MKKDNLNATPGAWWKSGLGTLLLGVILLLGHMGYGQCTSSSPFGTGTVSAVEGGSVTLSSCIFTGEYSTANGLVSSNSYTITGTGGTGNYLTIRNTSNDFIQAGLSPQIVTGYTGSIRVLVNTNSSCGTESGCHTLAVVTTFECASASPFGTGTVSAVDGGSVTLATCAFAGEYSTANGLIDANTYTITGTGGTGNYLTIRNTFNDFIQAGFSPQIVTGYTGSIRVLVNTNSFCGTESVCHTLTVVSSVPPVNNLCSEALQLSCGDVFTGSTFAASNADAPAFCVSGTGTGGGVWYTIPGNGLLVNITTCGSNYDTRLNVYSGICGALTCVTGNDDSGACPGFSLLSSVTFATTVGTNYYVYVNGFGAQIGNFTLNVTCTLPNDLCAGALPLSCGVQTNGSTVGATQSPLALGAPTCAFGSQLDVFYSFQAEPGTYTVTVNGSNYDGVLVAYSGGCGTLVQLTCADNGLVDNIAETINFTVTESTPITIRTYDFDSSGGDFSLLLTCAPPVAASIAGNVNWNNSCGTRPAMVNLYTPNTNTLVNNYPVIVFSNGTFQVPGLTPGTYDVIVKVQGYLAKGTQDLVVGAGITQLALGVIINGDVNNNNVINLPDVSLVNASFGSTTSSGNYNPLADLNCSGSVNLSDVSLLNAGFGQSGATAPL